MNALSFAPAADLLDTNLRERGAVLAAVDRVRRALQHLEVAAALHVPGHEWDVVGARGRRRRVVSVALRNRRTSVIETELVVAVARVGALDLPEVVEAGEASVRPLPRVDLRHGAATRDHRGVPALIVIRVVREERGVLPRVRQALRLTRRLAGLAQRRQQQPHQERDDRDHHQQFHEREPAAEKTSAIHGSPGFLSGPASPARGFRSEPLSEPAVVACVRALRAARFEVSRPRSRGPLRRSCRFTESSHRPGWKPR